MKYKTNAFKEEYPLPPPLTPWGLILVHVLQNLWIVFYLSALQSLFAKEIFLVRLLRNQKRELSFCQNSNFIISIFLQPDTDYKV